MKMATYITGAIVALIAMPVGCAVYSTYAAVVTASSRAIH